MTILIIQFSFITFLGLLINLFSDKKNHKSILFFLAVSFISMWYIHSMVVPDTFLDLPTYKSVFESIGKTEWRNIPNHWAHIDMELGYLYLNKLLYGITTSFTVFLWVFSFFMLFFYFKTIEKYSPYVVLSVLLLLLIPYNQSLFVIRQHMAMAICFATIPLIIERKIIPFLLIIISTIFFFHRSSFVFIPIYFLYSLKGKGLTYAIIIVSVLCFSLWQIILSYSYIFDYANFVAESEGANVTTFIQVLLLALLYVFALRKSCFEQGINKLLFVVLMLGVLMNAMSMGMKIGRITMYYNAFEILSVPVALSYIKNKPLRYLIGSAIILMFFMQMIYGSSKSYIESMQLFSLF